MEDKQIECVECREVFTFTAGEQEFFKEKGFSDPKRCKDCRRANKERRGE